MEGRRPTLICPLTTRRRRRRCCCCWWQEVGVGCLGGSGGDERGNQKGAVVDGGVVGVGVVGVEVDGVEGIGAGVAELGSFGAGLGIVIGIVLSLEDAGMRL